MFRALALLGSLALSALAQTGSLDFRVVASGNAPVAGASVTIEGPNKQIYSGSTERDGHLHLSNLAPGAYRFTAFNAPGYVRWPQNFLADLSIHEGQTREFQFELAAAPKMQGTVFDEQGNPVPHAKVVIWSRIDRMFSGEATADANGFYSMTFNVLPETFLSKDTLVTLFLAGPIPPKTVEVLVSRSNGQAPVTVEFEHTGYFMPEATVNLQLRPTDVPIR